ncbi:sec-independent translocase [uncultured Jatrophihabitans sp.]|uniref:sec-independent translocase n=1 Tax=uncultured Jatrophihabitans sp. TaxID=1610747 RepID=UPI0035C9F2B6
MFNVGPFELMVLAIVGIVVLGPDRLPGLARDAARMIRSLRDMATGARQQLRDELGPEFADVDLRNLNPRTALQRAVLGDEVDWQKYDPRRLDPRSAARNAIFGDDDDDFDVDTPVSMAKPSANGSHQANGAHPAANGTRPSAARAAGERPRPRPRPGPPPAASAYDSDAT